MQYSVAYLVKPLCTNCQNRPIFVEAMTKTFWLTSSLDTLYSTEIIVIVNGATLCDFVVVRTV